MSEITLKCESPRHCWSLQMNKVDEYKFTDDLYYEGSWGERDVGRHESTMTLYRAPTFVRADTPITTADFVTAEWKKVYAW